MQLFVESTVLDIAKFSLLVGNIPQYHYLNKLNYIFFMGEWVEASWP
jgi:hypothetical protein